MAQSWAKLSSTLQGIQGLNIGAAGSNLASAAGKFTRSSIQQTRERLGQINADDITELPQEYKDLEARVDALRDAHLTLLKITKVYESETYDYPTQIQESITELSTTFSHNITSFAATNLKGTNLPTPTPTAAPVNQHKTLPHALTRAATNASAALVNAPNGSEDKLARALAAYASAWDKVAEARIAQDAAIQTQYLAPWKATMSQSIDVAMKARLAVRASRLELDAAKQALKAASPAKQEHARLEVENAEDDLVQKTEVAITLMKTVLENPEPLKDLNELCKAQLLYYNAAAEALSTVQGDIEEMSVAAEGEYRKSRDH